MFNFFSSQNREQGSIHRITVELNELTGHWGPFGNHIEHWGQRARNCADLSGLCVPLSLSWYTTCIHNKLGFLKGPFFPNIPWLSFIYQIRLLINTSGFLQYNIRIPFVTIVFIYQLKEDWQMLQYWLSSRKYTVSFHSEFTSFIKSQAPTSVTWMPGYTLLGERLSDVYQKFDLHTCWLSNSILKNLTHSNIQVHRNVPIRLLMVTAELWRLWSKV